MPALMYHDVVPSGAENSSGFPGPDAALYKITPEKFKAHLEAIMGRVGQVGQVTGLPDPRDVHDRRDPLNRCDLIVTFDDGGVSAMRAADMLEEHRLSGWFFVT